MKKRKYKQVSDCCKAPIDLDGGVDSLQLLRCTECGRGCGETDVLIPEKEF